MNNRRLRLATLLIGSAMLATSAFAVDIREGGSVYTLSNAVTGNQVLVFRRGADGSLTPAGAVDAGGLGFGGGLGSQGAVALSEDQDWLFAVNAGSNSISAFSVRPDGLVLTATVPSGGTMPVSLTVQGHLLYVLNQGGTGNITGFQVGWHGELALIPGSTRPLSSSAAAAAEVAFSPNHRELVVSEKSTNLLDTYRVGEGGLTTGPVSHASHGVVPYGFTFGGWDELLVTEAGSNAVSSYDLHHGLLTPVSASVPSDGAAPCWIAATPDHKFAYAANAHIGTIARFGTAENGALTFLGVTPTPSIPVLDLAATEHHVYALAGGTHQILAFQIGEDGALTSLPGAAGLPASAVGLAVR